MEGNSPESYCLIDTPEKKKPLTREEDLPSAEESEGKEGEGEEKEGEGEEKKEKEKKKKSRRTNRKKTRKVYS